MTVQPQAAKNNRRLWSAAIGAGLLALGFARRRWSLPVTRQSGPPRPRASQKARRAWFEVIRLFYSAIGKHRVVSIAAGVTFFALLAIFPAIAALVAIYGLFSDPATIQGHLNELSSLLPGGAIEIIGDQLQRVASGGTTALGATFLVSLAISLWSANAGMKAMFDALKYRLRRNRISWSHQAKCRLPHLYCRRAIGPGASNRRHRHPPHRAQLYRPRISRRSGATDRTLAGPLFHHRPRSCRHLSIWARSSARSMALDHLGQRYCGRLLDYRFNSVFLVRHQFRLL